MMHDDTQFALENVDLPKHQQKLTTAIICRLQYNLTKVGYIRRDAGGPRASILSLKCSSTGLSVSAQV